MIFPELPRRQYYYTQQQNDQRQVLINQITMNNTVDTKTPLRDSNSIDVEQWFREHGLATGPAAVSTHSSTNEPFDWFARDAWELYGLIIVFATWLSFWLGIHRGWW
jgi:hypothetical protein